MEKRKKFLPPTYFFIHLLLMPALHFLFPITKIIHAPHTYFGIPLIVLGIILNIWADNLFSRHPMYLGFVVILLGLAILLGSLVAFLVPIAMVITLEKLFIPYEEKSLEKTFDKKYTDYKNRVRRWL